MRRRMCWRSTSSLVSPGPRVPMPPPRRDMASPHPRRRGKEVVELGQLDLGLALPAPRVQGEDVEDQGRAVDDLRAESFLQVPELPRRELVVEDHRVGAVAVDGVVDLPQLALPHERGRVGVPPALHDPGDGGGPGGVGQGGQLVEVPRLPPRPHADQHGALPDPGAPGGGQRRLGHGALLGGAAGGGAVVAAGTGLLGVAHREPPGAGAMRPRPGPDAKRRQENSREAPLSPELGPASLRHGSFPRLVGRNSGCGQSRGHFRNGGRHERRNGIAGARSGRAGRHDGAVTGPPPRRSGPWPRSGGRRPP